MKKYLVVYRDMDEPSFAWFTSEDLKEFLQDSPTYKQLDKIPRGAFKSFPPESYVVLEARIMSRGDVNSDLEW